MSAFVISIQNEVIDFARKCIIFAHHTHTQCADINWLWMLGILINFDTMDTWCMLFHSKKLDYFSVSFILIIITMNDWRPQILTCGKIVYFENKRDEWMPAHCKEKKHTHTQLRMVSPSWQRYATLLCLCSKHKTTTMNKKKQQRRTA